MISTAPVRLYSIPRVAEHLDTSRSTIYRLIDDGELIAVDIGREGRQRKRVREDDLARYVDSLPSATS